MTEHSRFPIRALAALALVAVATGCGGGGSGGGGGGGGGGAAPPPSLRIVTSSLNDAIAGEYYGYLVSATGGSGQWNFRISAGALPSGLVLDALSGNISGTPTGPLGTSNFTVTVMDSGSPPQSASQVFSLDIIDRVRFLTTTLPDAVIGAGYNQAITVAGGTPPYSFSITGSVPPPAGLSMSSAGFITGQATAAAITSPMSVRVLDSSMPQQAVTRMLTIAVPLEILTTALPDADGFELYSHPLAAQGGLPPYYWGFSSGSMPNGNMGVYSSGVIYGTPNGVCSPVTSTFNVYVNNHIYDGVFDVQTLSLTVNPVPFDIATTALPAGLVGFPYNTTVRTRGGALAFAYSTNGALPNGLGPIDSLFGRINGTPTVAGTRTFDVLVTDGCGASDSQALAITIHPVASGRNDSIASATPLGNGSHDASISPGGGPGPVFTPDQDYYVITTTAATVVNVWIRAYGLNSPLDPVVEFVDANGFRLGTCVPPDYNSSCMNDDWVPGSNLDSYLHIRLSGPSTFYVRVLDWRGDARPDLTYQIVINGVT